MQKKLIYILLLISLFSLTFGCQTESYDFQREDGSIEVLEDGRLHVPILLHIPEREVVETKTTTTPSDAEKAVKTVDVCVFDAASGERLEKVSGVIDPSNPLRVFAKVLPRNVACKVQVYVNIPAGCREAFNAAETLADMQKITMSNTIFGSESITDNGLPMVSTLDSYTALNSTTPIEAAKLTFAYARIDVNAKDIKGQFTLEKAYVFNAANKGYVIKPESLPIDDITKSPSDSINVDETTNNINGIYVFENNGELYQEPQGSTPTDLIIKGTRQGFGEGYYKIRIAYLKENIKTYDIRRGVRYAVKITSVKGPGYTSAEEAELHEPSNVECDITVNDGSSKDVIISNGKYYLGVSNSEYIIYADDARGVIPVTITHNAPSTVKNAKITLSGAGMSFSSSLQPELLNVNNNNEATMKRPDGSVHTIPLRIDFAANDLTAGSITIRIGDLVKTIRVVRKASIQNSGDKITDLFDNDNILVIRSHSDRIVVNGSNLTIKNVIESNEKDKLYSIAEAYAQNERGTIVIAIKKKISSVVYYEKYEGNRYGIYSESGVISTLSSSEIISETGYGVFVEKNIVNNINIQFSNRELVPAAAIQSDFVADSDFYLYPVNQNHTALSSQSGLTTLEVKTTDQSTGYYIYPNFAKGVYSTASITDGGASASPYVIRTPKQFRNINAIASLDGNTRTYRQERDLNFADANIGGAASFRTAIITNGFIGNYDGGMNVIRNLKIDGGADIALFASLGTSTNKTGSIKNLGLETFDMTASDQRVACLVAWNYGVIENVYAKKCNLVSNYDRLIFSRDAYVGVISGENFNTIQNCIIEFNDTGYTITSKERAVGCIVGCNHAGSVGISDCCVVASISPFAGSIREYTGGIVGYNNSSVVRCIYLARAPSYSSHIRPIAGYINNNKNPTNCYFLKGNNYNSGFLSGGGTGYTTVRSGSWPYVNGFKERTLESLGLGTDYWEKVTDYPYPKLKSFPTPSTWPVAN